MSDGLETGGAVSAKLGEVCRPLAVGEVAAGELAGRVAQVLGVEVPERYSSAIGDGNRATVVPEERVANHRKRRDT